MKPLKSKFQLGQRGHKHLLQVDLSIGEYYGSMEFMLHIRSGQGELLDVLFTLPYFELSFTICGTTWPEY